MARVASAAVALYGLLTTCLASEAGRCDVGESQACPAIGQAALQRAAKVQDGGPDLIQIEEDTNIVTAGGNSPCPNFVAPPSFGFLTGPWTGRCRRNPEQDPTCAITRVAKISDQEFIAGYKDGRWFKMTKFNPDGNIKQTAKYYSGTPADAKEMVAKYITSRKTGWYGNKYVFVKGVNFFNCSGEAPPLPPLLNQGKGCWSGCRRKQGPCTWCGSEGSCCRLGWRDKRNGCDGSFGIPRKGHVCVSNAACSSFTSAKSCPDLRCVWSSGACQSPSSLGVKNYGKGCWWGCGRKQGPCNWCGTGSCCRFGWRDKRNGCDGTLGIPRMGHVCTANPAILKTTTSTMTTTTTTTTSTTSLTTASTTTNMPTVTTAKAATRKEGNS
jgi:hypothetical protein